MSFISNLFGAASQTASAKAAAATGVAGSLVNAVSSLNPFASSQPAPVEAGNKALGFVTNLFSSGDAKALGSQLLKSDPSWFQSLFGSGSATITTLLASVGSGGGGFLAYQKLWNKDPRALTEIVIQTIKKLLSSKGLPTNLLTTPGAKAALESLTKSQPGMFSKLLSSLNPMNWSIVQRFTGQKKKEAEQRDDEAYQAGEAYADSEVVSTGLADDLKAIGLTASPRQLQTLIDVFKSKGKPIHDREMTMEKMIALTASLPRTSKTRQKLTGVIIDTLWSSLQHPPLSYLGSKYQYRTPDGSFNNPLQPDLGKAGSPYAKTVRKLKHLKGTPPDPGLLFDLLMARTPESFKENPAGVSSMLFYHATIIIHDIFRSNRFDNTISDTSSYLDLAPLYGSNLEDQLSIRTMSEGRLKPDTFAEKRLLGQPPGVNAILVMYSRFHNYVAETLLKINEYNRFTLPATKTDEDKTKALAKQDEDLFQTARLVTNGLYIQICLHDYLRGLTNAHHSKTDWTLDPRIAVSRTFDPEGVPRGIGNQVSAEFNLLYRFHATISLRDEKWTNDFLKTLFPDIDKPLDQLTPQEFVMGLFRFEQSIPKEPSEREFGGIKRGADGKFPDADLVKLLKESMEDPAGLFGARMVPKALKMIEIAGILSSRKWQLASLNETRSFFGLATHEKFEDINPDPEIADLLRKFYQDPDMVEIYPGLFLEDAKPRMDPGCGGCPPYTVGRAVFSDAVTLVRSDRFLTVDYTTSTLTNWGMQEVERDLDILGGSMFYKLFQRAFPKWFPYNSLHIMQPMFTRKMNEQIAKEIGTIDKYTLADPAPPPTPVLLADKTIIKAVLSNKDSFHVPWGKNFRDMFGGKRGYDKYMLAGDTSAHLGQRKMLSDILYASPDISKLIHDASTTFAQEYLKSAAMTMGKTLLQVDVLRDVGIPVLTRVLSDIFCLDLRSPDNKTGSLNVANMYTHLMNVRIWGFEDVDVALSWKRRMEAEESSDILTTATGKSVAAALAGTAASPASIGSLLGKVPVVGKYIGATKPAEQTNATLRWFGQNMVRELAASGQTPAQINDLMWLTAVGGVGASVSLLADALGFFLRPENKDIWEKLQGLATSSNSEAATKTVRQYVQEAQRLTSSQRNVRVCLDDTEVSGHKFKAGSLVVCLLGIAGRNPQSVADPGTFKLGRPADEYMQFGYGPHECLGKEISLAFNTAMIKILAGMKNLRPAPGDMGVLKSIFQGTEKYYLNDSWSYLTTDPSTWTLHFDGYGKGNFVHPEVPVNEGHNLDTLFNALKAQDKEDTSKIPSEIKDANKFPPPPISVEDQSAKAIINDQAGMAAVKPIDPAVSAISNAGAVTNGVSAPPATNGATSAPPVTSDNAAAPTPADPTNGTNSAVNGGGPVSNAAAALNSEASSLANTVKGAVGLAASVPKELIEGSGGTDAVKPEHLEAPIETEVAPAATADSQPAVVSDGGVVANAGQEVAGVDQTKESIRDPTATANEEKPLANGPSVSSEKQDPSLIGSVVDAVDKGVDTAVDGGKKVADDAQSFADKINPFGNFGARAGEAAKPVTTDSTAQGENSTSRPPSIQAGSPNNDAVQKPSDAAATTATTTAPPAATVAPAAPAAEPVDNTQYCKKIQQGMHVKTGNWVIRVGIPSWEENVVFPQPYKVPPRIFLGISTLDVDMNGNKPPHVFVEAHAITGTGFKLAGTVGCPLLWRLYTSWMAIPNEDPYKEICVTTVDTRVSAIKESSEKYPAGCKFTRMLYFRELKDGSYTTPPVVIPWLSGLEMKFPNNRKPPKFSIKGGTDGPPTNDKVEIAVECADASSIASLAVNVLVLPADSATSTTLKIGGTYINPHEGKTNVNRDTKQAYPAPGNLSKSSKIQSTIALSGADFYDTADSLRALVETTDNGNGNLEAKLSTWSYSKINGLWAWAITTEG